MNIPITTNAIFQSINNIIINVIKILLILTANIPKKFHTNNCEDSKLCVVVKINKLPTCILSNFILLI